MIVFDKLTNISMDAHIQEQYIQKKLRYKFDKKLDIIEQEYLKHLFRPNDNPPKVESKELINDINEL